MISVCVFTPQCYPFTTIENQLNFHHETSAVILIIFTVFKVVHNHI